MGTLVTFIPSLGDTSPFQLVLAVYITFVMEGLRMLKPPETQMLTIDRIARHFPQLTEFQLRKRLKLLVEANLIEERRADRYNQLLYSHNTIDFLQDLAALLSENGNLKKSVQILVSKVKGEMAYQLMSKEELIEIIQRQNREMDLLKEKIRQLRERFKPVERRGFWQFIKRIFKRSEEIPE